MSNTIKASGSCLCGTVSIEAKAMSTDVGACHCSMCQKWTGGPFMTVDCGSDVTCSPAEGIGTFSSSEWAERGFCKNCGSHLFYRLKQNGQHFMPVGLFDVRDKLNFDHQVFIDEKPSHYCFSNKTQDMTGAEVFAMFGGSSE